MRFLHYGTDVSVSGCGVFWCGCLFYPCFLSKKLGEHTCLPCVMGSTCSLISLRTKLRTQSRIDVSLTVVYGSIRESLLSIYYHTIIYAVTAGAEHCLCWLMFLCRQSTYRNTWLYLKSSLYKNRRSIVTETVRLYWLYFVFRTLILFLMFWSLISWRPTNVPGHLL